MRIIKFIVIALVTMFIGVFSVKALEINYSISTTEGSEITYSYEEGESLAYQTVKLSKDEYEQLMTTLENKFANVSVEEMLSPENLSKLKEYGNKINEAKENLQNASASDKEYAEKILEDIQNEGMAFYFNECLKDVFNYISNSVMELAPYVDSDAKWTNYTEKAGTITVDMIDANPGDVYIVYLKGVDNSTGTPKNFITLGGIFENNNTTVVPSTPEIFDTPSVETSTSTTEPEMVNVPSTSKAMPFIILIIGFSSIIIAVMVLAIITHTKKIKQK